MVTILKDGGDIFERPLKIIDYPQLNISGVKFATANELNCLAAKVAKIEKIARRQNRLCRRGFRK